MAYMSKGRGPYPNKAGEFCRNHKLGDPPPSSAEHLSTMRFGRPRPGAAGTTAEMEAQGYVGLYLKEDRKINVVGSEVPTPPELTELAAEGE